MSDVYINIATTKSPTNVAIQSAGPTNIQVQQKGIKGDPGTNASNNLIVDEIPSGIVDGSNATFVTANNFIAGSVSVKINGIEQKIVRDFQTIGNNQIQLSDSPTVGETIMVTYLKQ